MIKILPIAFSFLIVVNSNGVAQFTALTGDPTVTDERESKGVAWVDYDGDGDDDLFVTVSLQSSPGVSSTKDILYQNNGDGSFTTIVNSELVADEGIGRNSTWADFNNDGLIDVFITNQHTSYLYKNVGSGEFVKMPSIPTTGSMTDGDHAGAVWGDYNNDGYIDLFLTSYMLNANSRNVLFLNNKDETFTVLSSGIISTPEHSSDPSTIDYNNDGTLDIFVPNYCAENFLYANHDNGNFTSISNNVLLSSNCSVGAAWADYDNDGDFDVLIQNNVNQNNQLFENKGDGTFAEKFGQLDEHSSSSAAWGDFDNDGFVDLVQVGSFPERRTYLYKNNGNGTFQDVSSTNGVEHSAYSWGVAWSDYNKDGFLDLFIANAYAEAQYSPNDALYINTPNANGWISIKLQGKNFNRSAIGAIVKIKADGKWQMRTVQSKSGNNSQNSHCVHFGIGGAETLDTLLVEWPGNGYSEFFNQNKNEFIDIAETDFPEAPSNLTATNSASGEADLVWANIASGHTGFRIERSAGSQGNFKPIATVSAGTTTFKDTGLNTNTNYFYRVASSIDNGFSNYSNITELQSVTDVEDLSISISIYPNPAHGYFIIDTDDPNHKRINIFDSHGIQVYHGIVAGGKQIVSIQSFPAGLYMVMVKKKRFKIIKT